MFSFHESWFLFVRWLCVCVCVVNMCVLVHMCVHIERPGVNLGLFPANVVHLVF